MRVLTEDKIDIVNQIAVAICKKLCVADKCGECEFGYLKTGIDLAFGEGMSVEDIIEMLVDKHQVAISQANRKYDTQRRYKLHDNKV